MAGVHENAKATIDLSELKWLRAIDNDGKSKNLPKSELVTASATPWDGAVRLYDTGTNYKLQRYDLSGDTWEDTGTEYPYPA